MQRFQKEKEDHEKRKTTYVTKIQEFETELKDIEEKLEKREAFLAEEKEKEVEFDRQFNQQFMSIQNVQTDNEIPEEEEEDEALMAIEAQVKEFHKLEESVQELDCDIQALTEKFEKEIEDY